MALISTIHARIYKGTEILMNNTVYTVTEINEAANSILEPLSRNYTLTSPNGNSAQYHLKTLIENNAEIVSYPEQP